MLVFIGNVVAVHWPPFRAVLPNVEVVEFQPQSVTYPDLVYVSYCCVVKYYALPHLPLFLSEFPIRDTLSVALSSDTSRFTPAQDHPPTWSSPVPIPEYRFCDNSTLVHLLPPPVTPSGLPLPLLPCFFQNLF